MKRTKATVYRERALLVGVQIGKTTDPWLDSMEELEALAQTAGSQVIDRVTQRRDRPDSGKYVGSGKASEIAELVKSLEIDVVIFDNDLSPAQLRDLEKLVGAKVIDRTELILDIFATHARSNQAKLQVELAQLEYTLPRIHHMWSHLGQQKGGIGQRGPGEKQIESDRRLARKRIAKLKEELSRIEARKRREVSARSQNFTASLVGYTNAGKSTLMRRLTGADVLVEDRLFSTLDTKTQTWRMANGHRVLLSDTVGFIRNLPHHLVASFHATLEEAMQADLLLHVVDASHPEAVTQVTAVQSVLAEMGCADHDVLLVFNKVDALRDPVDYQILSTRFPGAVEISAATGEGIDALERRVTEVLEQRGEELEVEIPLSHGRAFAYVADRARVLDQEQVDGVMRMRVRCGRRDAVVLREMLEQAPTPRT
ncbi:MAG: GTPase HflX [Planctomycetota bacterium]